MTYPLSRAHYLATYKVDSFHIKYDNLCKFIVRAMDLYPFRIIHTKSKTGVGYVILHTQDLYVMFGHDHYWVLCETDMFCYKWCKNLNNSNGGNYRYMLIKDLHNPDKVINVFKNIIEEKYLVQCMGED